MGTTETNSSALLERRARHAGPAPVRDRARPYQQVAMRVRDLAMQSAIGPGQRLPSERDLAAVLAVSRATLRQALTSLELDGFVEVRSCSGIYLCALPQPAPGMPPARPGPFELLSARRLIEPELAAMAARVAKRDRIDAILAAAAAMERAHGGEPADPSGGELANRHFHLTLADASGNAALASVLDHLWRQRGGLWHALEQLLGAGGLREATLSDYRRIADAVAARDAGGARSAMRAHLERFTRALARS
jgi:DNA-binding FadR family transcriptional regulator